jgi:hypothetical protein
VQRALGTLINRGSDFIGDGERVYEREREREAKLGLELGAGGLT